MSENAIQNRILLALGKFRNLRIFRNHVGKGVTGKIEAVPRPMTVAVKPGDFIVRSGRMTTFGLAPDTPDLVGWETLTVTPAMVGRQIAVIFFVEVKDAKGSLSQGQRRFIELARSMGVRVTVARSEDEAVSGIVTQELL